MRHPEEGKVNTRLLIWLRLLPTERSNKQHGPLAQSVEHLTFNQGVAGSRPARPTRYMTRVGGNPLLNDQPDHAWPAGFLFASTTIGRGYNNITDNGDETLPLVGPLTLQDTIVPNNANETKKSSLAASSMLPEYDVEVVA